MDTTVSEDKRKIYNEEQVFVEKFATFVFSNEKIEAHDLSDNGRPQKKKKKSYVSESSQLCIRKKCGAAEIVLTSRYKNKDKGKTNPIVGTRRKKGGFRVY